MALRKSAQNVQHSPHPPPKKQKKKNVQHIKKILSATCNFKCANFFKKKTKKKPSGECPRVLKEEFEKENYRGINETAL